MGRWQAQIKANREAPSLDFVVKSQMPRASTAGWAATTKPETEMELEIAAMLEAGGVASGRAAQVQSQRIKSTCACGSVLEKSILQHTPVYAGPSDQLFDVIDGCASGPLAPKIRAGKQMFGRVTCTCGG